MKDRSHNPETWTPLKIVTIYAFIGVLWILFSDQFLFAAFSDPDVLTVLQTVKGWFYVAVTASLLYLLIARMSLRMEKTNQELLEEKEYNTSLIQRLPIGLALCHMDGRLVDVNPAYAALLGRTVNETMTLSYWDITPEKYTDQERAQLESLRKKGRYGPYEKEYIHKDGHLVPVRLSGLIVRRNDQDFIWSTVEDITSQQRASQALRQSEEKFMKAFHATPDAIIISRANDGLIVDINDVFVQQSEYTRAEALGRTTIELKLWADPNDRERFVETLKEQGKIRDMATRFQTKSGRFIDCLVSGEIFSLGDDSYLLTIARDITEHLRAEQELSTHREHLEELVQERTEKLAKKTADLEKAQTALQYLLEDVNEAKKELETKVGEIERMNRVFVDRELRMVELKEKIRNLKSGREAKQ